MKKTITLLLAFVSLHMTAQCWTSISKGPDHTVARKSDGTLWSWGYNNYGQLGNGTNSNTNIPLQIGAANNWQTVSAGESHTVAIKANGTLWTWGYNNYGQLGDGSTVTFRNTPAQIGTATNWKSVSAGGDHTVAVKTDGTLWAWGYNQYCQLGDGSYMSQSAPIQIGSGTNWTYVSANQNYTMAIKTDGTLWAWGRNNYGQLGDGTLVSREVPVQIGSSTNWKSVSAGYDHTVAVKTNGTLWTWGEGFNGKLGFDSYDDFYVPTQVGTATDWKSAVAGEAHTLAVKTNGTLWACGYNAYGQLAYHTGSMSNINRLIFNQIGTDTNWSMAAAGYSSSAALKTDNTIMSWGLNQYGQAGIGPVEPHTTPTAVACYASAPLAAQEFEAESAIKVYPNPVQDMVYISNDDVISSAAIYNVLGQQVAFKSVNANEAAINISDLKAGTYFVKVTAANAEKAYTIIKQ